MTLPSPIRYHIYTGQELPPARPYAYVLAGNGLWKVADTPHFYASLLVAPARVAGLACWPECGVLLRVPKVPARWLRAVVKHAQLAWREGMVSQPIEQMYHFHWFPFSSGFAPLSEMGEWRVSVPFQHATAGRVSYAGGSEATVLLDLHSHHEMGAYFSDVDNNDEQGCRFYAVLGRIYSRPELRLRLGLWGDWLELPAAALFEGVGEVPVPNAFTE